MVRRVYCMLALVCGIMLAACTDVNTSSGTSVPTELRALPSPTPSSAPITPLPTAAPTSSPVPSPQPLPVLAADDHLLLLGDRGKLQLQAQRGGVFPHMWLDDSHLLATWREAASPRAALYLVNLAQPGLKQLAQGSGDFHVHMNDDRSAAMILWQSDEVTRTLHAGLLSLATEQLQMVFASSPAVVQWVGEQAPAWAFASPMHSLSGAWVDRHTFVLAVTPEGYSLQPTAALTEWGELLLVDTRLQRVRGLGEQGQLLAVFPDGALLVRQGWIDGALQILPVPDFTPKTIATSQAWKSAAVVSPDQQKVAWIEWAAPPGDWSHLLPLKFCCGGQDPEPHAEAIVVWDRAAGQSKRLNVAEISWARDHALLWRQDSSALIYVSRVYGNQQAAAEHTTVMEATIAGAQTPLQRYPGLPLIRLGIAGGDGSLYYALGTTYANAVDYIRLHPDGHSEVLRKDYFGATPRFFIDAQGQVQAHVRASDQPAILDLFTDAVIASARQSPGGTWEWSSVEGDGTEVLLWLR